MKKLTASLLSALMFLTSCMNAAVSDESTSAVTTPQTSGSVTSYGFDLDNLNYNPQPGIIDSTLRIAGEISPFSKERQISAPEYCMDGQYTYMIRSCPREITTEADYIAYRNTGERIREIEVYENHNYSAPVRVIPLTGLDDKDFWVWEISYNPDDGNFYLLLNEGSAEKAKLVFYKFSSNGEYIDSRSVKQESNEAMLINKGKLYSVKNGGWSDRSGKLVCEDPFTGTSEVLHESVMAISFTDNVLYYVRKWVREDKTFDAALFTLDPKTGKEIQLSRINPDVEAVDGVYFSISGACWDDENDVLYVSQGSELKAVQNGEVKTVLTAYDAVIAPESITDGYLNVSIGNTQRMIYYTEEQPDSLNIHQLNLNVCFCHPTDTTPDPEIAYGLFRDTIETMNASGISVNINFTYLTNNFDEYINTMAKKFLSGDSDYDLFLVTDDTPTLFDSRYFEDLYAYDVLAERYDHMIPGLKELFSVAEKAALIPFNYVPVYAMWFRAPQEGVTYDLPTTFDEFFSFHDEIADELPENMYYYGMGSPWFSHMNWFHQLNANFMTRTISNETAERDLLKLFENMVNLDSYEAIASSKEEYDELTKAKKKAVFEKQNNNGAGTTQYYIAFPKMSEEYKYQANVEGLGLNPNSPNKELAVAFLAYHMNTNNKYKSTKLLFTDKAESFSRLEDSLAHNSYQSWKAQIADSIRDIYSNDFHMVCFNLSKELEAGLITPGEAAEEAFRYMRMVRDE